MKIGIDYETYSNINLKTDGLDNYIHGEEFAPLMCSVSHPTAGEWTYDFILDPDAEMKFRMHMERWLEDPETTFIAHNAGFERAVYNWFGIKLTDRVKDSAVYARMLGVGEKLEVASRQLLPTTHKLAIGNDLIKLFCIPNERINNACPTPHVILSKYPEEWIKFTDYCEIDAKAGREIAEFAEQLMAEFYAASVIAREDELELITYAQNQHGWHIDREVIKQMSHRAWANSVIEQKQFFLDTDTQLNFNSPVQLKKYCEARGVKVASLDKYQLPVVLERVEKDIAKNIIDGLETKKLEEVRAMLLCKQELGGSSLSKLQKILDLAGKDDQLRDQYIHVGAGQTYRTSGRGVQMQNLKKLSGNIREMETVFDYKVEWSNTDMAAQLRQVFTASHADGELIVGDFSAVESRGLAYLAGEEWKLDAYREGKDVYCALVTRFEKYKDLSYEEVADKEGEYYQTLRPRGKYSELSCGYQASAKAVKDFMFRLGFVVSIEEAAQNVLDWRGANPLITQFWRDLDYVLKDTVQTGVAQQFKTTYGQTIRVSPFFLKSIQDQHPGATSLMIQIVTKDGVPLVNRVIHGAYFKGNSLVYYKPEDRLNGGPLWSNLNKTASQKAKKDILLTVYGGKLAGILTQSLCRELFYDSMKALSQVMETVTNARMVGQFHDEIVVDWWPSEEINSVSKEEMINLMNISMSFARLPGFPLSAEIKSAYRYIK